MSKVNDLYLLWKLSELSYYDEARNHLVSKYSKMDIPKNNKTLNFVSYVPEAPIGH